MSDSRVKENRLSLEIAKYCKQLLVLLKNSYDVLTAELQLLKRIIDLLYSLKCIESLKVELIKVLRELIKRRLKTCFWREQRAVVYVEFLNVVLKEGSLWATVIDANGLAIISKLMSEAARSYNVELPTDSTRNLLVLLTGLFCQCSEVSSEIEQHQGIIHSLVLLMSSKDHQILENSLVALLGFSKKASLCKIISHLNSVEILITIIDSYDHLYKSLSSELLAELLNEDEPKQMVKICEGILVFLRQLAECDVRTCQRIVQCLCKSSRDQELANEIKFGKGLEIMLSLLHNIKYHPKNQVHSNPSQTEKTKPDNLWSHFLLLKSTICECLAELVCYDNIAFEVVQINAIFLLSILILPPSCHRPDSRNQNKCSSESSQSEIGYPETIPSWSSNSLDCEPINAVDFDSSGLDDIPLDNKDIISSYNKMQMNALKALRFIFSLERNRGKFKKLFTPSLFEKFIDVGHYNRQCSPYEAIVKEINKLDQEILEQLKANIQNTNINKIPMKIISDYAVIDILGAGAFGTVYKVHKLSQPQTFFAMKEVYEASSSIATNDGMSGIKELHTELNILQENLCHQNIVQYYKSFIFDKRLYIVMEYIDGATLEEHLSSTKEKGERLSEERIWNIFVQLVLGLRYLHKEKRIVHRDLKPNNVMMCSSNRVILTDFGLAKQKNPENSKMISVVGSILYSSPELVKNEEYGEKVDIWSLGCLLYQMCQLKPPFYGSNMLALVAKIVESRYEPADKDRCSTLLTSTIDLCLTSDQKDRPDINGVASFISSILLAHLDEARKEESNLKKKLENEKAKNSYNQLYEDESFMASQSHDSGYLSSKLSPKMIGWSQNQPREMSAASGTSAQQKRAWGSPKLRARSSDSKTRKNLPANQNLKKVSDHQKLMPSKQNALPPFYPKAGAKRSEGLSIPISPQGKLIPSYEENVSIKANKNTLLNRRLSRSSILPNVNTSPTPQYSLLPDLSLKQQQGSKVILPKMHSAPNIHSRERALMKEARRMARASSSRSLLSGGTRGDPSFNFFSQLHKIIYITQMPPSLQHCPRRKIVEDFKRQLFQGSQGINQSMLHIQKLMEASNEAVGMKMASSTLKSLKHSQGEWCTDELTYTDLKNIIDQLLEENNY